VAEAAEAREAVEASEAIPATETTATAEQPPAAVATSAAEQPATEPELPPAAEATAAAEQPAEATAAAELPPAAEATAEAEQPAAAPEPELPPATEQVAAAASDPAPEPERVIEPSVAAQAAPESEPVPEPGVEQAALEQLAQEPTVPQAAPAFNSAGSDVPVVLTTPVPHVPESRALGLQQLWSMRPDWLPRAHRWSQKTLRRAPRALVIGAPVVALFGLWLGHRLVTHHGHTAPPPVEAPVARATVAVPEPLVVPALPVAPAAAPAAVEAPVASAVLTSVTETPSTTAPAVALAAPAELVHALTRGLPALEALAARFPADPQVAIALAGQQAQAQRYEAAVASVEHALAVDPSTAQNGKVMGVLWRAAQSPASEQSFLCLRKLGARGSDVAFDLATTSGVRDSVRERAKAELTNYLAFDASPDTRAATALLLAPDCTTRKALLDRAESDGGKRTLGMLERFARGSGCTSSSEGACNSCLLGSPVLAHALSKLSPGAKP
jgi:hypothetical protein